MSSKRKLQSDFEKDEKLHINKKRKLNDDRYYIMTTSEAGSSLIYEIDTSHKMFKIVIDGFIKNEIPKEEHYCIEGYNYEISLYYFLTDTSYYDDDNSFYDPDESKRRTLENDEEWAIRDFLGLDEFNQMDFKGFIIKHSVPITMDNIDFKRNLLLKGRVLYLESWC